MVLAAKKYLKIGLVLDTSLDMPDGVQQYVISIGEWLRAAGHDVHYLVGETKRKDLPNIHSLSRNISVISNGNRTTIPLPTRQSRLRKFLEVESFDVLHVQVPYSPFMAQHLIKAASPTTAVVGTFHIVSYSWAETLGTKFLGIWLRTSLKRFDQIISVSSAAAEFASATFNIQTEILPNVVDYQLYHNALPWPQYDDELLNILFLGRLVTRKGCQTLLEALIILKQNKQLPKYRVLICGRGHLEVKLKQFAQKNEISELVNFVGFVSETDKPRYYASADIAVFPSKGGESFGIVLLEAMASGQAAVLAGDNPGYRSVISAQPDQLFDPNDASGLAEKLAAYLTDNNRRRQAQVWGESYTKQFDVAVVGTQLLNIYRRALIKRQNK